MERYRWVVRIARLCADTSVSASIANDVASVSVDVSTGGDIRSDVHGGIGDVGIAMLPPFLFPSKPPNTDARYMGDEDGDDAGCYVEQG
jgi:hypothetical protein